LRLPFPFSSLTILDLPDELGVAHETGGGGGPGVAAFGGHGEVASPAGESTAVLGTPQPRSRVARRGGPGPPVGRARPARVESSPATSAASRAAPGSAAAMAGAAGLFALFLCFRM
ncbi:unnamed protein product, partial [Urochloa humidicola]